MHIILIDKGKKELYDYVESLRQFDDKAWVRGFSVSDRYRDLVLDEIAKLEFPVLAEGKRLHVKCFGKFEVYVDGVPLTSKYNKTRELFAYLVDKNGSMAELHEIQSALWEGDRKDHISYLKNIRSDMIKTLEGFGLGDIIVRQRGRIGLIPDLIECDYYDMLIGKKGAIVRYNGEYMSQYSWAEYTNAALMDIKEEYLLHHGED